MIYLGNYLFCYLTQLIFGNETFVRQIFQFIDYFDLKLDDNFFFICDGWTEIDKEETISSTSYGFFDTKLFTRFIRFMFSLTFMLYIFYRLCSVTLKGYFLVSYSLVRRVQF